MGGLVPNNLLDSLKNIYSGLEAKWYAFLDQIDEKIHVYPLIDQIDKVVPSFVVFLCLVFLMLMLLIGGIGLFLFGQPLEASIKVIDEDSNPVQGIDVSVDSGSRTIGGITDEFGEMLLDVPSNQISVEIVGDGFEDFSGNFEIESGKQITITLKKTAQQMQQRFISVVDAGGNIVSQEVQVRFSCSSGTQGLQQQSRPNGQEFVVQLSSSCGTATAIVSSAGFNEARKDLTALRTTVTLFKSEQPKSKLQVYVKDEGDNSPVSGIKISVYNGQNVHFNTGLSDESGTKEFEVRPGIYFARATDETNGVYLSKDSSLVEINSGATETIIISLSKSRAPKKQLLVKFADRQTEGAIENVKIRLFENGLFVSEDLSNSAGIIKFLNKETVIKYSLVAQHSEYVTKAIQNLPLLDDNETTPYLVQLEKANPQNSGSAEVSVIKAEGGNAPAARVLLFNPDFNFDFGQQITDNDGNATFTNLPPGEYYAKAFLESFDGKSGEKTLEAGQTIKLPIILVLKQGFVEVNVTDTDGKAVPDATVKFYDFSDSQLIEEGTTGSNGKTEKIGFPWTKKIYFVAGKDDFANYLSSAITLKADSTTSINVVLKKKSQVNEFNINLVEISEKDTGRPAQRLSQNKSYLVKFNLELPQGNYSVVDSLVRAGLQEDMNAASSLVVIKGVNTYPLITQEVYSFCYNAADDFADCNPANTDAKQARVRATNIDGGIYEFVAEIFIKPTTKNDAVAEFRFGAKATRGTESLRKPLQGLLQKSYRLNTPIDCSRCPNFIFDFRIKDAQGLFIKEPISIEQGKKIDLIKDVDYAIDYEVWNREKKGKSYSNISLDFVELNSDGDNSVELLPSSFLIPNFENNTSLSGPTISLKGKRPADIVKIMSRLSVPEDGNSFIMEFRILPKKEMLVEVQPASKALRPGQANYISVKPTDKQTGIFIRNAIVKFSLSDDFSAPLLIVEKPIDLNFFVGLLPSLELGQKVFVKVEAIGYVEPEPVEFTVVKSTALLSPITCVDITGVDPNKQRLSLSIKDKASKSFYVSAEKCDTDIDFFITQNSASGGLKLQKNLTVLTDNVMPSFSLQPTDGKAEVRVTADEFLGEYDVVIKAKVKTQTEYKDLNTLTVYVVPGTKEEGYCFAINKTSFDLASDKSGEITNRCKVKIKDSFNPKLMLESDRSDILFGIQKPPEVAFNYNYGIDGTLNHAGEDTRHVTVQTERIISQATLPINQVAVQSVTQAVGAAAALSALLGGGEPEMMIALTFVLAAVIFESNVISYNSQIYGMTCEECSQNAAGVSFEKKDQSILLGTDIQDIWIQRYWYNDGGYLRINGEPVTFEGMGNPPSGEEGVEGLSTSLDISADDAQTAIEGALLGSIIPGLGPIMGILSGDTAGFNNPNADSCGGIGVESNSCSAITETYPDERTDAIIFGQLSELLQNFGNDIQDASATEEPGTENPDNTPTLPSLNSACENVASPSVKDLFMPRLNNVEFAVCNKYNEGGGLVEFGIKDSVHSLSPQIPAKVIVEENRNSDLGELSGLSKYYISHNSVSDDAGLSTKLSNDSAEALDLWLEGNKIKGRYLGNDFLLGGKLDFELRGKGLEGEDFAVIKVVDYASIQAPALELVYIVDGSRTFDNEWATFCGKKSAIENELEGLGITVYSKVYEMGDIDQDISVRGCADAVAVPRFGNVQFNEGTHDLNKAWAGAVADVASKHQWNENAKRAVIVLADSMPTGKLISESTAGNANPNSLDDSENIDEVVVEDISEEQKSELLLKAAVQAMDDLNATGFVLHGIPMKNASALASLQKFALQTNGALRAYTIGDETGLSELIASKTFGLKEQSFHVRLKGTDSEICIGANNQVGLTGANALPRRSLDWSWNGIIENTCDALNPDYSYCDAVQFNKSVLKRLFLLNDQVSKGDLSQVNGLLNFDAYLIKDSYSNRLLADFDNYAMTKEFLVPSSYKDFWHAYVSDDSRFSYYSTADTVQPIPESGLYRVNIEPEFQEGKDWIFFNGQAPIAKIKIKLTKISGIASTNPLYHLPFDGEVGLTDTTIQRNGYGVLFSGDELLLSEENQNSKQTKMYNSNGTAIESVQASQIVNYSQLNGNFRGQLLKIRNAGASYEVVFSPTIATPVLMELSSSNGNASAYYSISNESGKVSGFPSLGIWTGVASDIGNCKSFNNENLPVRASDSTYAASSNCGLRAGISDSQAYGFSWANATAGKVFYKTIFYVPNKNYEIANACANNQIISTPAIASDSESLKLDYLSNRQILSLNNVMQLVKDGAVCVSEANNEVNFWWNENYLYNRLEENYANYFADIQQSNPDFRVCTLN